jgi:hypothetical protein
VIPTLFRGADYPLADRFDQFCEVGNKNLLQMRAATDRPHAFNGEIRAMNLGVAQVSHLRYSPLVGRREPVYIRRDDRQRLLFLLVLQGTQIFEHNREQVRLSPGDILLHGTWHPWTVSTFAPGRPPATWR